MKFVSIKSKSLFVSFLRSFMWCRSVFGSMSARTTNFHSTIVMDWVCECVCVSLCLFSLLFGH